MRRLIAALMTALFLVPLLVIVFACSGAEDSDGQTGEQGPITSGKLIFGIGMHIEPRGATPSAIVGGAAAGHASLRNGDYNNPQFFAQHVEDINTVASIVEGHQGRLTVQAQTPFTSIAAATGNTILADLASNGHEIGLHFHEDSHLGKDSAELPASTWCAVMKEEIGSIRQAAGDSVDIRYWSGGNLYPDIIDAASCAGLSINSDWKNPQDQKTSTELLGVNPWRPVSGANGSDVTKFATHDPEGPVVYLPEGMYDRANFASARGAMGDQAYFDYLKEGLMASLKQAEADPSRVSVFHFTVHPGEFRGDPEHPFAVIDRFLAEVVDPLVVSGKIQWGTFSQMADAYSAWEQANPGVDPISVRT